MTGKPKRVCSRPGCHNLTDGYYCELHRISVLPKVTVVAGPPGAGKTTLVRELKQADDLVLDLDPLKQALTYSDWYAASDAVLPFALEARDAILRRLDQPSEITQAWIIGMHPKREQREDLRRRFNARVIVLATPADECLRRISADAIRLNRPSQMWSDLIWKWWREYEPDPRDEVRK